MLTPGKRLKMARELTNISRTLFCQRHKISLNSMNAWETDHARFSEEKANLLCETLEQDGVIVNKEWLITGQGDVPYFKDVATRNRETSFGAEDDEIRFEANRLKHFYGQCFIYHIHDDSAMPFYQPGDIVGGVPINQPIFEHIKGQLCIVELINGAKVIRRIDDYKADDSWNVSCINIYSQIANQQNVNLKLKAIAPIIWFRRKIQND